VDADVLIVGAGRRGWLVRCFSRLMAQHNASASNQNSPENILRARKGARIERINFPAR